MQSFCAKLTNNKLPVINYLHFWFSGQRYFVNDREYTNLAVIVSLMSSYERVARSPDVTIEVVGMLVCKQMELYETARLCQTRAIEELRLNVRGNNENDHTKYV